MTQSEITVFIKENKDSLLNLNSLIELFSIELNQYENKAEFIQKKLETIKSNTKDQKLTGGVKTIFSPNITTKQSYFCSSYENELYNNDGIEKIDINLISNQKIIEYNGVIWAQFQKHIQNTLQIETNNIRKNKDEKFSRLKRVLILDYLGVKNFSGNATETAKLISPLLNVDYNSIRDLLREINNTKEINKNLLIEIRDYFKNLSMIDTSKRVQKDIDKIK